MNVASLRRLMGHPSFEAVDEGEVYRGLRKLAREVGFNVKRRRKGGYELLQAGRIVAGERQPLTIEELAKAMMKRHIIGFGGEDVALPVSDRKPSRRWIAG